MAGRVGIWVGRLVDMWSGDCVIGCLGGLVGSGVGGRGGGWQTWK